MMGKPSLFMTNFLKMRNFSTYVSNVPLTRAIPGFNLNFSSSLSSSNSAANISKLSNGLRVASQDKFGMHCTVGVMLKAGPRYESGTISGVSHFLEKLGFHSTDRFRDRDHIQSKMESCNSIFDCQISRDFIVYAISGLNKHLSDLVHVLSETVLRPKITKDEVNMAARAIGFELASLEMAPPTEPILNDLLHSAAFHGCNTFGFPRYCPTESIGIISRRELMQFMASYYRPERTVVVGVGVDHSEFTNLVESSFMPWETSYGLEIPEEDRLTLDDSLPVYSGGEITVDRDLSQYHAPMPEFAHCVIGLESCGSQDPQFVPSCLLNSLLGGGGSFSAGGPGKGMYSRLYTNVLNQYHWVNSAQATNHAYADAGVFGIAGSAEPANLHHLVQVLAAELRFTAEAPIPDEELQRAKNQLESMLLMNLEMNPVAFEDIARQVLASDEWKPPDFWVEKINAVSAEDLHNLLIRMFKSPLTLVGFGRMSNWPELRGIQEMIAAPLQTRGTLPSLFKRFV
ncbi:mitochondrial processing peptidase [Echinococcus multilocularis]|uniref:Alpha-MPP n=1 Tax=Echinococcus multilocularis TaxID=6211 RepID=A0A087VXI4_ECHMU|nr:mitochondrial processing peptidase [Echinococcus multilocularis]